MGDDEQDKNYVIEKIDAAIERQGTTGMRVTIFIPDGNYTLQKMAVRAFVDSLSKPIGENVPIKRDVGA